MKILIVASARKGKGLSPFISEQIDSIMSKGEKIETFIIPGSGLINYFKSIFAIHLIQRKQKFDLIHAHYGFSGIASLLALPGVPVVVSFMGDDVIGNVNNKGNYSISGKVFAKTNLLFAKYFFAHTIVKSANLKKLLLNNTQSTTIPNGINLKLFHPILSDIARRKLKIPIYKKTVLFAGNPLRPVKNYKLFKDALNLLMERNLDIQEIALADIPFQLVNYYYNAADVVVLTSIHEGSPNVIKEAMACNCPIVSTDVGDVKEIIKDTEGCFICEYDPSDVADKINNALYFGKRTNGRKKIQHLEKGIVAENIIGVYYKVLSK